MCARSRFCSLFALAGVDAAIAWLLPRQGDPALDAPLPAHAALDPPADWRGGAPPPVAPAAAPAAPAAVWTPGVAGILRREQEQAAALEQCATHMRVKIW